jgi:hypothetical protein
VEQLIASLLIALTGVVVSLLILIPLVGLFFVLNPKVASGIAEQRKKGWERREGMDRRRSADGELGSV